MQTAERRSRLSSQVQILTDYFRHSDPFLSLTFDQKQSDRLQWFSIALTLLFTAFPLAIFGLQAVYWKR